MTRTLTRTATSTAWRLRRSGRVLLHMVRDRHHPDYENLAENRRRLETTDALGRELEVVEFDLSSRPVTIGEHAHRRELHELVHGQRRPCRAHWQARTATWPPSNGCVRYVPGRQVVGVPAPIIAFGGGGVHCITQQVPRAGR